MTPAEIVSFEPATGAEIWRGPPTPIEPPLAAARAAWRGWAGQGLAVRGELLRRFANELLRNSDEAARLVAREVGKPWRDAQAEVEAVLAQVEIAIRAQGERAPQRRRDNGLAGTLALGHKPHGVMVVISPWTLPLLAPAGQILPALLAGNTVVFKPSEKAPACGRFLVDCLYAACVPAEVLHCVVGGPEAGLALASADGVDAVAFAGSAQAGVALNRKLAARPDRLLTLEMGGNNPLVVWDTPLVDDVAALVVQSAFGASGQRSTAARRLIVKSTIYDRVMPAVKQLADRLIIGAPFDEPAPFMGPIIDNVAADGLTESFVWLMSNGARPIKHMARPRDGLPFVTPGIIDVTAMAEKPDVELFGPLLQVIRVESFEAAIAVANATRFGLVAGLIGGSPEEYRRFWAETRAGIVTWNRPTTADLAVMPMGGVGLSGNHRAAGLYAPDYCAYPVASAEAEQPRAVLGAGLAAPPAKPN